MCRSRINFTEIKVCLEEANRERAKAESLIRIWDWNGSVMAAQRSIRCCMKTLFHLVGETPSSDELTSAFDDTIEKLKKIAGFELYYQEKLLRLRWIASVWVNIREELVYAYGSDAKILKGLADETYEICTHLVSKTIFYLKKDKNFGSDSSTYPPFS